MAFSRFSAHLMQVSRYVLNYSTKVNLREDVCNDEYLDKSESNGI